VSFYKFNRGDLLLNTFTARPEYNFFIYDRERYINYKNVVSGTYSSSITNVPPGYVNLYELNVNRDILGHTYDADTQTGDKKLIFPWIYAQQSSFLRLSNLDSGSQKARASSDPAYEVTGSYPLSSSINYYYFSSTDTTTKTRLESLRNTLDYYTYVSPHYVFSGSIPNSGSWKTRDLNSENVGLITIPAIINGNGIKKGSVSLKFYVSGTLQAELSDINNQRGELIQYSGSSNNGQVAGVVLYKEGSILLTGSWSLNDEHQENYVGAGNDNPKWAYFGSTILQSSTIATPSSSYALDFKATEKIPTLTMMTHAGKGELNFSNNPTFISSSKNNLPLTGTLGYFEQSDRAIKNIVSSSFTQTTGSFEKITYITKIGIYDEYKNLIGIANLANPVRKREQDSFTFKLKYDL